MRDYVELILDLRRHHCDAKEDDTQEVCEECAYDVIVADKSKFNGITDVCTCGLMHRAADAIEELLAENKAIKQSNKDAAMRNKLLCDEISRMKEKVPHWISVEDRLPEDFQKVLVFWWEHGEPMIDAAFWQKDAKRFDGEHWVRMEDKVTHWMPLPAPPKWVE